VPDPELSQNSSAAGQMLCERTGCRFLVREQKIEDPGFQSRYSCRYTIEGDHQTTAMEELPSVDLTAVLAQVPIKSAIAAPKFQANGAPDAPGGSRNNCGSSCQIHLCLLTPEFGCC
jgi:hypothetical protein